MTQTDEQAQERNLKDKVTQLITNYVFPFLLTIVSFFLYELHGTVKSLLNWQGQSQMNDAVNDVKDLEQTRRLNTIEGRLNKYEEQILNNKK